MNAENKACIYLLTILAASCYDVVKTLLFADNVYEISMTLVEMLFFHY